MKKNKRLFVWFFMIAIAFTFGKTALAQEPIKILPLKDVRQGMIVYGETVLEGQKISTFKAKIIGTIDFFGNAKLILAKMLPPFDRSGALAGMSGTPMNKVTVYAKKKNKKMIIGALAYGVGNFAVDDSAKIGITPIEYMLHQKEMLNFPLSYQGDSNFLKPIPVLFAANGSNANALKWLQEKFGEIMSDFSITLGGNLSEDSSAINQNLAEPKPGSSFSIGFMKGAVNLFATGTITWTDSVKFLGFGHSILGQGRTAMPAYLSEIAGIHKSSYSSFKIVKGRTQPIGTIIYDGAFGVEGVREMKPDIMLPVTLKAAVLDSAKRSETYDFSLFRHKIYSESLVGFGLRTLFEKIWNSNQTATVTLRAAIYLKDQSQAINISNISIVGEPRFSSYKDPWGELLKPLESAIREITQSFWSFQIEKIEVDFEAQKGARILEATDLAITDGRGSLIDKVKLNKDKNGFEDFYLRIGLKTFDENEKFITFVQFNFASPLSLKKTAETESYAPLKIFTETANHFTEKTFDYEKNIWPGKTSTPQKFLEELQKKHKDFNKIYIQLVMRADDGFTENYFIPGSHNKDQWEKLEEQPKPRKVETDVTVTKVITQIIDLPLLNYYLMLKKDIILSIIKP